MTQSNQKATLDSVYRPVLSCLARLAQQLRAGQSSNGELEDLQDLLETLPLSSEEFGLACNRLRNAQRFLEAQEPGAAKWELNALQQRLRTTVEAQAREPRRRKQR